MRGERNSVSLNHRQAQNAMVTALRIAGLWIIENDSNSIRESLYKIYNKLVIINICIFAIAVIADLCFNYNDLIVFTNDGCIFAGISMVIFKMFNFQIRSKRIRSISEKIHTPVDVLDRSTDPGVRAIVQACDYYEKLLLYSFSTASGILLIALMFVPVEVGELPIRAEYPFDTKAFPMHQVAVCMEAWTVSVGLIAINGMDRMVIGLCNWINVQIIILSANYENCGKSKTENATMAFESSLTTDATTFLLSSTESTNHRNQINSFIIFNDDEARAINDNDTFLMRYKICVKHHQRIVNVINEMNEVFSSSMIVQLFTSFSMICLAGFQAVLGAHNLSSLIKFGVYMGTSFCQLVNWCWVSNSLIHQSVALSTSQWSSGWEEYLTPKVASLMIISMTQSHKSLGLRAGKFFMVSMQTCIVIIRNCYSFFAILTEMNSAD